MKKEIKGLRESFEEKLKVVTDGFQCQLTQANIRIAELEKVVSGFSAQEEIDKKKKNIIISGIPDLQDVNVNELMKKVCNNLGLEHTPKFHANKYLDKNSSGTISVKFHREEDKHELMSNYFKSMNLSVKDVILNSKSNARIYINHDLTKSAYEIQKRAAFLRKERKIYQFRIINGRVGIKFKTDDSKFKIFTDLQALNDLYN